MATSQPLETIPEEPTTAPTQPNSPTPARVTADPPKTKPAKNPGRVASGKKLAEQNRRAREALKKVEAEEAAAKAKAHSHRQTARDTATDTATDSESDTTASGGSGLSLGAMLGIGGLIVSLLGVYYQREAIMATLKPAPPPQPAPAPTPAPSRISVKRGIKEME